MSTEKLPLVQLLPKGQFFINTSDGNRIKGRFSMYALQRFGDDKGHSNFLDLLDKITAKMSIPDYADLILYGIQDYFRDNIEQCPTKRDDIMKMIEDEFDGISEEFLELALHAIGRIAKARKKEASETIDEDKKKESTSGLTGKTSDSDVIKPD